MRTYLLHPYVATQHAAERATLALEEARSLTCALTGLELVGAETLALRNLHPGTLFGSGKVETLAAQFRGDDIGLVIIDGVVSPVQQRNLERAWQVKLLDRTGLILEIFGDRARTREGVLQVELAHMYYAKSRLVRSWTHLERQRGGGGFLGGPGETQIEADRRALDDAIIRLKRQLGRVEKTRALHRAARARVPYPIVALVGYTNAGKSTLFNRLTGAETMAQDMLFATLDPTMRSVALPSGKTIILSDTVGFISDLPTQLVAAFRATLEEVLAADLIVHVRDISHPDTEGQAQSVETVLSELDVAQDRRDDMIVFANKIDRLDAEAASTIRNVCDRQPGHVAGSAVSGVGVPELMAAIETQLTPPKQEEGLALAADQGAALAWLHRRKLVVDESFEEKGMSLRVLWGEMDRAQFFKAFPNLQSGASSHEDRPGHC